MFNRSISVEKVSQQTLLQRSLVGSIPKAGLRTIRQVLALSHSRIISHHVVALDYSMLGGITLVELFLGRKHTGTVFILA